jgi:hypothetical protein
MNDRILRLTSVVFLAALLVHGADHMRRGIDAVTTQVRVAGTVQFALAVVTVALVFRGHRLAPLAAIAVGFASAAGFAAAHLLPNWGEFSDAFTGSQTGPEVTAFSWFTALFEIVADVAFAWAGVVVLRRRGTETLDTGDAVSVA